MTAHEIATLIGEFVSTEIDDVNRVEYTEESDVKTAFIVIMENGKRFSVNIQKD